MEEDDKSNKQSQSPMAFPPYRRSHFRSQTYHTLVRILSHLPPSTIPTQSLNVPDNDIGGLGLENKEKEPASSEINVGSNVMDPKGSVSMNETHDVHETVESVEDMIKNFSVHDMILDDIEFLMERDEPSEQINGFHSEQTLMNELELVVKETGDPVRGNGLILLNSGLKEKQNSGSEVDLMDYQVEHVELLHSGTSTSGSVRELQSQVPGEFNQLASEECLVSGSTKGQASASVISTSSLKNKTQQKETELVKPVCSVVGSLSTIQEGDFEKEEQNGHKLAEPTHISLDLDKNIEASNMTEDGGLLDSTVIKDKSVTQSGEKSEKIISVNNETHDSNILIEEGGLEEGEISGDFEMDGNTFDVSSADATVAEQMKVDEVQLAISREDRHVGSKVINDIPTTLTQNQVLHNGFLEETATKDRENSSPVQIIDASKKKRSGPDSKKQKNNKEVVDTSRKRKCESDFEKKEDIKKQMVDSSRSKRGPGSKEKKTKKRKKYRKNRAEKNRELGVKRLKLIPVQKPKTIQYCRHYMNGRCHEGDKCNFSHDTVPSTKSTPCTHFARHSCMKGDDCPFDHNLSKYPCSNFLSKGSCYRGDACLFSHQVPINQDIPTPSNACKPELKSPLPLGHTNFSTPLNNHGCNSVQQNRFTNSKGVDSQINAEHKVTDTSQKQPTSAPKGIRFINVANLSPSLSTPKQDTVTPSKGSLVRNGTCTDKGQNIPEIPKKLPSVTPKGINFLSFGKSSVCSFKSSIGSHVNKENGIKLPQSVNFGLPEHSISFLNKDDYGKVSDRTAQNLPQTALFPPEILDKNQSMAEIMKSKFLGKDSTDDSARDRGHWKSVQEVKKASENSQASTVTSAMLLARPVVSHQSSECQRALLSTLAFATEHESDIKMKCPTGASPV
uniref:Uncharacterized protein LOC101495956 isoform X2 n=1 Tax=Cicer arietinum TaxID=3827 RepID=A0A3Q7XQT5_CICAR|nr:uncharacterized protein LOC101495956 isoform X2 [Cicer arietinum]